jgi:hypothetical protein
MNRRTGLLCAFLISTALFATAAVAEIKTVTLAVSGMT